MTDSTTPAVVAGWYPDPAGGPGSRWWDGTQWTENFQAPYSTTAPTAALRAPEGTDPYTPWIWVILGVMVLMAVPSLTIDYSEYYRQTEIFTSTDFATIAIDWIGFGVLVLLAFADWKRLKSNGVPIPFHWAWMFFGILTPLVYVIGRSVVVRRRTGKGIAPLWVAVTITVAAWIAAIAVSLPATLKYIQDTMDTLPGY